MDSTAPTAAPPAERLHPVTRTVHRDPDGIPVEWFAPA